MTRNNEEHRTRDSMASYERKHYDSPTHFQKGLPIKKTEENLWNRNKDRQGLFKTNKVIWNECRSDTVWKIVSSLLEIRAWSFDLHKSLANRKGTGEDVGREEMTKYRLNGHLQPYQSKGVMQIQGCLICRLLWDKKKTRPGVVFQFGVWKIWSIRHGMRWLWCLCCLPS